MPAPVDQDHHLRSRRSSRSISSSARSGPAPSSSTGSTSVTSPTSGPGKAGSTSPPSSTSHPDGSSGWAMADHMRAELVCDALRMAIDNRRPGAGSDLPLRSRHPIHLDRVHRPARRARDDSSRCHGLANAGTTPWRRASSRRSSSSASTDRRYATRAHARRAVFDYIEVFYNRRRLHSSLGYLTPAEYENKIRNHTAAHAA